MGGRDRKSSGRVRCKGETLFLKRGTPKPPLHPLCGGAPPPRTFSGDRWNLSRGTFPSTIDRVPAERVSPTRGYFQVRCTSSENSRGSGKPAAAGIARSFGKPNPAGSRHRETIERPLRAPARRGGGGRLHRIRRRRASGPAASPFCGGKSVRMRCISQPDTSPPFFGARHPRAMRERIFNRESTRGTYTCRVGPFSTPDADMSLLVHRRGMVVAA